MKSYATREAAQRIGISFRTLNRWIGDGRIKPSLGVPYGGGRTLWRFTDSDISKGRKIKGTLKPGRKHESKKT